MGYLWQKIVNTQRYLSLPVPPMKSRKPLTSVYNLTQMYQRPAEMNRFLTDMSKFLSLDKESNRDYN